MADNSNIEWTDATWPVTVGCDRVSPGCDRGSALRDGWRLAHHPNPNIQAVYGGLVRDEGERLDWTGVTRCVPERLDWPLRWRRPRCIFVCSQSDLFHQDIPTEFVLAVFDTMRQANQHTYQVLTKRPSRAALLVPQILETLGGSWPQHIWMGVSVECQDYRWRVDKLRLIPAPTRFISAEPLLGPLSLNLADCRSGIRAWRQAHGWGLGQVASRPGDICRGGLLLQARRGQGAQTSPSCARWGCLERVSRRRTRSQES